VDRIPANLSQHDVEKGIFLRAPRFLSPWTQSKSTNVQNTSYWSVTSTLYFLMWFTSRLVFIDPTVGISGWPHSHRHRVPYTLFAVPSTADGPIAWPAGLQRLINRGNLTDHTMGVPKKETQDNREIGGTENKGQCSVHCPSPAHATYKTERENSSFFSPLFFPLFELTTFLPLCRVSTTCASPTFLGFLPSLPPLQSR